MNSPLLFLGDLGGGEIMLIMVVILIFFGANKIPELARGLGKGIREFKDASSEIRSEFEKVGQTPPPSQQAYQQPAAYATPPAYEATLTDNPLPVQHHDTPLPGNPTVIGTPLADGSSTAAPAYGTPDTARPRLDQTHSSEA
ncbi:twin-arginine translocase TatA/TatE family subunit [uncultured Hymenobacter sp.]|uniref:twin-arginine translocase TatA/TatE family subunit n=1 Tax=uncultured Hymenobacter sp. TaxID=170016 RepID=UPI0035CB3589